MTTAVNGRRDRSYGTVAAFLPFCQDREPTLRFELLCRRYRSIRYVTPRVLSYAFDRYRSLQDRRRRIIGIPRILIYVSLVNLAIALVARGRVGEFFAVRHCGQTSGSSVAWLVSWIVACLVHSIANDIVFLVRVRSKRRVTTRVQVFAVRYCGDASVRCTMR